MKINEITAQDRYRLRHQYDPQRIRPKKSQDLDVHGKEIADVIKKRCSAWLNEGVLLERGFSRSTDRAFFKKTRMHRQPRDTEPTVHDGFNELIRMSGKVANRSNSVFCFGYDESNRQPVRGYGERYIVFPVGEYNYTWHTQLPDWSEDFDFWKFLEVEVMGEPEAEYFESDLDNEEQWDYFVNSDHGVDNFKEGIRGDDGSLKDVAGRLAHEIMVKCEAVYAVEPLFFKNFVQSHL